MTPPPDFEDVPQTGAGIADVVAGIVARKLLGWLAGVMAAGLVVLIAASLVFWSTVQADTARSEEVHRTLQRDVASLDGDLEAHGHPEIAEDLGAMRTDLATLRTKVDAIAVDVSAIEELLRRR